MFHQTSNSSFLQINDICFQTWWYGYYIYTYTVSWGIIYVSIFVMYHGNGIYIYTVLTAGYVIIKSFLLDCTRFICNILLPRLLYHHPLGLEPVLRRHSQNWQDHVLRRHDGQLVGHHHDRV